MCFLIAREKDSIDVFCKDKIGGIENIIYQPIISVCELLQGNFIKFRNQIKKLHK